MLCDLHQHYYDIDTTQSILNNLSGPQSNIIQYSPHHAATQAAVLQDVSSKPRRHPQQHEVQGRPHHLFYNHHCLWRPDKDLIVS